MRNFFRFAGSVCVCMFPALLAAADAQKGVELRMLADLDASAAFASAHLTAASAAGKGPAPIPLQEMPPWARPTDSQLSGMESDRTDGGRALSALPTRAAKPRAMPAETKPTR